MVGLKLDSRDLHLFSNRGGHEPQMISFIAWEVLGDTTYEAYVSPTLSEDLENYL